MRIDDSCPYCKNRKLLRGFNDLVTVHPELAAEWDFGRNGDLRPDGVRFNSIKQVWWRGGCGHEWQMSPRQRAAEGLGCPYCSGPVSYTHLDVYKRQSLLGSIDAGDVVVVASLGALGSTSALSLIHI